MKHSTATHAIVQVVMNDNQCTMTVEDNGKGFEVKNSKNGIGLKNVEQRVKSLAGELQIDSVPGKGTTVYMQFECQHLHM